MRRLQIIISLSLILFFAAAAGAKIVFSAYQNESYNIYVMDDDGSNIRQITYFPHMEVRPRWSSDGTQIAFLRDTDPSDTVRFNTFIMNADGTNVRRLTSHRGNDRGLAFSPDGKKVVVSRIPNRGVEMFGLYLIDIENGDIQKVSDIEMIGVDWSSDGKEIVFANDDISLTETNIWIMNTDGTDARPLIPPIPHKYTIDRNKPRWSPNGQLILYTEADRNVEIIEHADGSRSISSTGSGTFRYMVVNLNGGRTQALRIPNSWYANSVAWMDGQKSVLLSASDFEQRFNRNYWGQLYKYDIASGTITQLTHGRSSKWGADWVRDDASTVTSVSAAGKQSVRWGELKKAYLE